MANEQFPTDDKRNEKIRLISESAVASTENVELENRINGIMDSLDQIKPTDWQEYYSQIEKSTLSDEEQDDLKTTISIVKGVAELEGKEDYIKRKSCDYLAIAHGVSLLEKMRTVNTDIMHAVKSLYEAMAFFAAEEDKEEATELGYTGALTKAQMEEKKAHNLGMNISS